MRDPYEILGVGRNATKEEIKAAYMQLVKKYHPDKYQDNPLADLAQEKLKEINEAYDILMNNHQGTTSGNSNYYGNTSNTNRSQNNTSDFNDIRQYINMGNIRAAEAALNNSSIRNAEWFYLSGITALKKGWYDDALSKLQQAVSMDPGNYEYQTALNSVRQQGSMFRNTAYGRGYNSSDDLMCKLCQCYICADVCCDCI